jgi:hypothetical protein
MGGYVLVDDWPRATILRSGSGDGIADAGRTYEIFCIRQTPVVAPARRLGSSFLG